MWAEWMKSYTLLILIAVCSSGRMWLRVRSSRRHWFLKKPCISAMAMGFFTLLMHKQGKAVWTFQTDGEIVSSANATGGRILFGSYDQFLYCLASDDGALLWKIETDGYVHGMPAIAQTHILIAGCDGLLRVIDIASGKEQSQIELGAYVGASAAVYQTRAYVGTYESQVLCLDLNAKEIAWSYEHPQRKFPYVASPSVTPERVIVAGRDKMVHALDPDTGVVLWTYTSRSRFEASPVVAGDRVFAGTTGGKIVALNLDTGELGWEFVTGSEFVASPSVARERLIIGTTDGTLYCFGKAEE